MIHNNDCTHENEFHHVTSSEADAIIRKMPTDTEIQYMADLFKIFGDATRLKILAVLLESGELCVCDIALTLEMSQSSISHQLRVLKQSRLVKFRRSGKTLFYSLADEHVITIMNQGLVHINEP